MAVESKAVVDDSVGICVFCEKSTVMYLQYLNTPVLKLVTLSGIFIDSSEEQLLNI
jgi:hypothetical protein